MSDRLICFLLCGGRYALPSDCVTSDRLSLPLGRTSSDRPPMVFGRAADKGPAALVNSGQGGPIILTLQRMRVRLLLLSEQ